MALMAVQVQASGISATDSSRGWRSEEVTIADVSANIDRVSDEGVLEVLGGYPVALTRAAVQDARDDKLSLFATALATERVRPGSFPSVTVVLRPGPYSTVSGTTLLDGGWASPSEKVDLVFQLEPPGSGPLTIAGSTPTGDGYIDFWHSSAVPNGDYELRTKVTTSTGTVVVSSWVPIVVDNPT